MKNSNNHRSKLHHQELLQTEFEHNEELEAFDNWLRYKGVSKQTQKAYLNDIRRFLFVMKPKSVASVRKATIISYIAKLSDEGVKEHTRNRRIASLRTFFKALNELELLSDNPAKDIEKAKLPSGKKPAVIPMPSLLSFFELLSKDSLHQSRNICMFLLMYRCGLRVGEVRNLNVSDLLPDSALPQALDVYGKGKKSRRIPIEDEERTWIAKTIAERPKTKSADADALFVSQHGRRISIVAIEKQCRLLREQIKAKFGYEFRITPHKFRHTFATELIREQVDIETVRELLGHSDIQTTAKYLHTDEERKRESMRKIKRTRMF